MFLYSVQDLDALEILFNCTFIYIQKLKILSFKNLSDVQISYTDVEKMKYGNKESTQFGIWYLLCMLLIISFTLNLFQHIIRPARVRKGFVRPTDHFHQFFT